MPSGKVLVLPIRIRFIGTPSGNHWSNKACQQCCAVKEHVEGVRYEAKTEIKTSTDYNKLHTSIQIGPFYGYLHLFYTSRHKWALSTDYF